MNQSLRILGRARIAAPCDVPWSSMQGDEPVRLCGHCEKQVYNFTAMSPEEAALLVIEKEGRLCARMYQRTDGTMLSGNCPVGLQRLRRRIRRLAGGLAVCLGFLIGLTVTLGNPWRRTGHARLRQMEPMGRFDAWLTWIERMRNPPITTPIVTLGLIIRDPHVKPKQFVRPDEDVFLQEIREYSHEMDEYRKCTSGS